MKYIFALLSVVSTATPVFASGSNGFQFTLGPQFESGTMSLGFEGFGEAGEIDSWGVSGYSVVGCGLYRSQLADTVFVTSVSLCGYYGTVSGSNTYSVSYRDDVAALKIGSVSDQEWALRGGFGAEVHDDLLVELVGGLMAANFELSATTSFNNFSHTETETGWAMGVTAGLHATYKDSYVVSLDWVQYQGANESLLFGEPITFTADQETWQLSISYQF